MEFSKRNWNKININTGFRGGIIQNTENKLVHSVHWVICLLHLNELPLRKRFTTLDGIPTGRCSFNGAIGKELPFAMPLKLKIL